MTGAHQRQQQEIGMVGEYRYSQGFIAGEEMAGAPHIGASRFAGLRMHSFSREQS